MIHASIFRWYLMVNWQQMSEQNHVGRFTTRNYDQQNGSNS